VSADELAHDREETTNEGYRYDGDEHQLLADLHLWLDERPDWPGATTRPALLLNRRGGWLTTRGASRIFHDITEHAGLEEDTTACIGRHTFATTLIRGGTDLVVVADLLGHARLDTVRTYTRPTAEALTHYPPTADQPICRPRSRLPVSRRYPDSACHRPSPGFTSCEKLVPMSPHYMEIRVRMALNTPT
jgi:hypothetical protein